jgi:hypothetical protein
MTNRSLLGAFLGLLAGFGWWWSADDGSGDEVRAASRVSVDPAPAEPASEALQAEPRSRPEAPAEPATRRVIELPEAAPEPAQATPAESPRRWSPPDETTDQLAAWLDDLRDDDVAWNATRASSNLTYAIRLRDNRDRLRPLAEPLLYSSDRQQRLLVTTLLMRLETLASSAGDGRVPHPLVEQRALEWLARPEELGTNCRGLTPNAFYARTFCLRQGPAMHGRLADKLSSSDAMERFYAALLLGTQGVDLYASEIAAVLVPHLADNRIEEDALEAAHSLKKLGPAVLQWLPAVGVDEQQTTLLNAVRQEIHQPGSSASTESLWEISQSAPYGPVAHYRSKAY